MKKYSIIALVLAICLSLAACGRRNDKQEGSETTNTTTSTPTIMEPTFDTNIPDSTVNSNSTNEEDTTESTGANGMNGTDGTTNGMSEIIPGTN